MRSKVDFPEPERPITTKISPGWIVRETCWTAALGCPKNCFETA